MEVQATSGERWCGSLRDSGPGTVSVVAGQGPVAVSLQDVAAVRPVESC